MNVDFDITATSNGLLNNWKLLEEINASSISIPAVRIDTSSNTATVVFASAITSVENTTLLSLVAVHDGSPDSEEPVVSMVEVVKQDDVPAFASKILPSGKSLFKRGHGMGTLTVAAGAVGTLVYEIIYLESKLTGVEVINGHAGDQVSFEVLDSTSGVVTTYPNYPLNQFGFGVYISEGHHREESPYDADAFYGMQIRVTYENNGTVEAKPCFNIILHEVK